MSRIWKYKYGGTTTSSHPSCPARVLLHGRCPKGCPGKSITGGCYVDSLVDHERLEKTPSGEDCFVASFYYLGLEDAENYKRLKEVCDFHGLNTRVEVYPWNGVECVSHVKIIKPSDEEV